MQVVPLNNVARNTLPPVANSVSTSVVGSLEQNWHDAEVSKWGSNPPPPPPPQLIDPSEVPQGIVCGVASGLYRFSRALSKMGNDTSSTMGELLLLASTPILISIAIINEPLRALTGLALRKFGADKILKRMSYDAAESDLKTIIFSGGSYFRPESQEQRYQLAEHCLAKAIQVRDIDLQRACRPKNFGITDTELTKKFYRLLLEHVAPEPHFGLIRDSEINPLDREFRIETLSKVLGHGQGSNWLISKVDLDQLGHIQAQKRHLSHLSSVPPKSRNTWLRDPFGEMPIEDARIRAELAHEYM